MKYKFLNTIIIIFLLLVIKLNAEKTFFTISGVVTDKISGEYVIGLNIAILPTDTTSQTPVAGTFTNKFGFYSIPRIKTGSYILRVTGIGYQPFFQKITGRSNEELKIDIALEKVDIKLEEIQVEAERYISSTSTISTVSINPMFITKVPSLGSEIDIFRTLQLLPGVSSSSELNSGLYIRGGSPDQNLILLDGVIVYNPNHLFGFLSTFNNDAIKDIKLIKGGFPAEYGGRLSSVLDLNMKEGTKEKFSGSAGISLISSRLTLEGPITENSTFMVSGRRMYLDVITSLLYPNSNDIPSYYFYDLNAKINYKLDKSNHLFLSGFFCRDVFATPEQKNEDNFNIKWGNATGNFRWMHIFSPQIFSNFSLIYTHYKFNSDFNTADSLIPNFSTLSGIEDFTFRGEFQYFLNTDFTIKSGIEATNHRFEARANEWLINLINEEWGLDYKSSNIINSLDAAFYIQNEWKINPFVETNFGGRLYYFQEAKYWSFEPRFLMTTKINEQSLIKTSLSLAHQFLHLITRNDFNLPTDLWFPSTETIKPGISWQVIFGYETTLLGGDYLISAEIYYKDMFNLYEYKDDAEFSFGIPLETQFTKGKGWAYGLEIFLNKRFGKFTGWIGYTLAWTKRVFNELNEGRTFYPRYDRRHDINLVLTTDLSDDFEIGVTWIYGTGQAFTMPTGVYGFYDYNSGFTSFYTKYHFSERNGYRIPAYHRMDLNLIYKFQMFNLPFQLSLNVYNLYSRKNTFSMYVSYSEEHQRYALKKITLFPIIPTLGLSFKF